MLTNEILRFIDNQTFAEAEPPTDRSRPLEWRRSFNTINFIADSPSIEYVYSVNDVDHFAKQEAPIVSPVAKRRLRIVCQIDQDKLRDSIYFPKEKEKNSGLYQLHRTKDAIQVVITDASPTDQRGPFATGAFAGLVFRTDFEPGEDGLSIEVSIPTQHLEELASALKAGDASALHIAIALQSFSYEVDDALREWYHPRDLFIHGSTSSAALLSVRLTHRRPDIQMPLTTIGNVEAEDEAESQVDPLPIQPLQAPKPDYSSALKSIKTVLWAIAVILLLQLAK